MQTRLGREVCVFALLAGALPAIAGAAEPGTATATGGTPLVDGATGDAWMPLGTTTPSAWTLTGPARFQVGVRLNLPQTGETVPAGIVSVRHRGKQLAQFRVLPRAGKDTWKNAAYTASPSVGFYIEVAPGDQPYEFRLNGGGPVGGAVYLIDATKSKRPLPANAPVVAIPAAPLVAAASPTATPAATPALAASLTATTATAAPTPTPDPVSPPAGARPGRGLAVWLGASQAAQTRTFVTGSAPASELALGARWSPVSLAQVWLSTGFEQSEDLVPLTPAPVTRIPESRLFVDAGGGVRLEAAGATLVVGPAFRYASVANDEVSYSWVVASLAARAEVPFGPLTASAGGEAGIPVSDGTPGNWGDGELLDRYAWSAGARYTRPELPLSPSLGLEYRGEQVDRRYSELVGHGVRLTLQMEF